MQTRCSVSVIRHQEQCKTKVQPSRLKASTSGTLGQFRMAELQEALLQQCFLEGQLEYYKGMCMGVFLGKVLSIAVPFLSKCLLQQQKEKEKGKFDRNFKEPRKFEESRAEHLQEAKTEFIELEGLKLSNLNMSELRELCKECKLPVTGLKADLVDRLLQVKAKVVTEIASKGKKVDEKKQVKGLPAAVGDLGKLRATNL